uniref:Tropomodulin n=1 Tax=Hemiscolopendra marginata TaxID=943146 RepID=A0A646QDA9_9MYRI
MFTVQEMEWTRTTRTVIKETKSMTSSKLFGKDLSIYDEMDIDELLSRLTTEELEQLSKEVDPDDALLPAHQRCRDQTTKLPTGPLNRKHLLEFLERKAKEEADWPELKPHVPGIIRGKIWQPKDIPKPLDNDEDIALDVGDEFETALEDAEENELVDLAAILGLHSMMNQDQYHASITNKGQTFGARFESIVKASQPKFLPMEPPNPTDVDRSIEQVEKNDQKLIDLNLNNIKNISKEKFSRLFEGLKKNTKLESLSLANTKLSDASAKILSDALVENRTLKTVNVESNFISPPVVRDLVSSLLNTQSVEEFRATNQKPEILGVKIEMEIAKLVEDNKSLRRLGLSFDVPDARIRVQHHLQRNNDNVRVKRVGGD